MLLFFFKWKKHTISLTIHDSNLRCWKQHLQWKILKLLQCVECTSIQVNETSERFEVKHLQWKPHTFRRKNAAHFEFKEEHFGLYDKTITVRSMNIIHLLAIEMVKNSCWEIKIEWEIFKSFNTWYHWSWDQSIEWDRLDCRRSTSFDQRAVTVKRHAFQWFYFFWT